MISVFCDIDGTLVSNTGLFPQINLDAIKALQQNGDHFVLVSGRNPNQIKETMTQGAIDCDYIFGNGAGYRVIGEEPVYNHTIPATDFDALEKLLEIDNKIFYHLHTSEGIVIQPLTTFEDQFDGIRANMVEDFGEETAFAIDWLIDRFNNTAIFVSHPFQYLKDHPEIQVIKAEFHHADPQFRNRIQNEATALGFYAYSSFLGNLEIVPPNSNKGTAIQDFLALFPSSKTYAIGDGMNDETMFDVVDIAVAVENADPKLRALADEFTTSAEDGGVGSYIINHILK